MWRLKIYQKYIPLCSQWDLYSVSVVYEKKTHLAFNNLCLTLLSKLNNYSGWIDNNSRASKKSNKTKRTDFFEKKFDEKNLDPKNWAQKNWAEKNWVKKNWAEKKLGRNKNWADKKLGWKKIWAEKIGPKKILAEKFWLKKTLAIYWPPHPQGHTTIHASSSFLKKLHKNCLD